MSKVKDIHMTVDEYMALLFLLRAGKSAVQSYDANPKGKLPPAISLETISSIERKILASQGLTPEDLDEVEARSRG